MRRARRQGGVARAARGGGAGGALCPPGAHRPLGQAQLPAALQTLVDLRSLSRVVGQGPLSSEGICSLPQAGRGAGQTGRAKVACSREAGRQGAASYEDRLGTTQDVRAAGAVKGARPGAVQPTDLGVTAGSSKLPLMTPWAEASPLPPVCEMGSRRPVEPAPQTLQPV